MSGGKTDEDDVCYTRAAIQFEKPVLFMRSGNEKGSFSSLFDSPQAVVLMGGIGSRLSLPGLPKSMADVNGRPFFTYQLELMKRQGIKRFVFCVGHLGQAVEEFFGDGANHGVNIRYSYDGPEPLGTAGALRKALPLLDDDFFLIYGDSFMNADFNELACAYAEASSEGAAALMAVFRNDGLFDESNAVVEDGRLVRYEKGCADEEMCYIDYGASVMSREVVEEIDEGKAADLADLYARLVSEGRMAAWEVPDRFYEIGSPQSLDEFRDFVLRASGSRPAVFIDRDGTLNEIVFDEDTEQMDSPFSPEQLRLLPGAAEGLRELKDMGYLLVVVTNQPAAAKGKTKMLDLNRVNRRFRELLASEGVSIDDLMMCPHHPEGSDRSSSPWLICECDCRKPRPGLLLDAAAKHNIDLGRSFMLGDSWVDMAAGREAGVATVFIGEFKCDTCSMMNGSKPDMTFASVRDFSRYMATSERKA